ncbi:MAG: biotin carboxylase N-terminal domain-containing protein [Dehalococcoidia bacterium]|nr:biotin carboxylase N-terminal domain-containing protein [Dehalococcoidia bacterium]
MFSKVLIANRGEIAVRIMRTCADMGIGTVAVYSQPDTDALHVRIANESFPLTAADPSRAYLDMKQILDIAERSGAEAIHPGYGFLAEDPEFVKMCSERGVVFIGPPGWCMYKAKPRDKARQLIKMINLPLIPGSDELIEPGDPGSLDHALEVAQGVGYPVIVKPVNRMGTIGIAVAKNADQLRAAAARFPSGGSNTELSGYYIEKYIPRTKHIEFQVLADSKGNAVYLGERDCSIQRRFQNMMEEAPCPVLNSLQRMKMGIAAIDVSRAIRCVNALAVEFLYSLDTKEFFFNEVNYRLQVEHCINELTSGIDVVREQIRIAAGEELTFSQDDIRIRNHAVECRVNAEDPFKSFLPSPGKITKLRLPHGFAVRVDEGVYEGCDVPPYYDSLLFKISAVGRTRDEAMERMARALAETSVEGIKTNLPFQQAIISDEQFRKGTYTTNFVDERKILHKLHLGG